MIDAKAVLRAQQHLQDCHLCPHHCGPVRAAARGVCRVGQTSYIASEMLHLGEEELLRPAHAIFFSGCTATCHFCTAAKFAFRPTYGVAVSPAQLAGADGGTAATRRTVDLLYRWRPSTTHSVSAGNAGGSGTRKTVPTVFNSNFYLTDSALDLLNGAIDIYLPDLKFGPAVGPQSCGERIGGMPDYWSVVTECIDQLYRTGQQVIVRHLLMPGHFACCTQPILHWLAARPAIQVSLLTQYLAPAQARGELAATLSPQESEQATTLAHSLGLSLIR